MSNKPIKLRELIRAVRACKTAAEERSVIAKECALIRTAFKEEDQQFRHRNVAKLLYINMLGYPTHFGRMECLKLIASPTFPEKRIGYLGLMLLLDEREEVLMLVTNSLKQDLNNTNHFIAGLALTSLGNISSPEMARDLAPEVEKILRSSNPYLKKKAALAAVRIVRKVPELAEDWVQTVGTVLSDRNHGALIGSVCLMIEMLRLNPEVCTNEFRRNIPQLVRLLKNLVLSGYAPEHDVSGITDPYLQCKILQLLCMLGKDYSDAGEQMNDILAQVATNTESAKNAGNAILYDCVQVIMVIDAEPGLRVLAINILGRFLLNRDNNIRYVALSTLCKVVQTDTQAVQRHRSTIVDCLKDPDISIRRRALELIYNLANASNAQVLVKDLLHYLSSTLEPEFKTELVTKICLVIDKYAPTKKWHFDSVSQMLVQNGNYVTEDVARNLILIITQNADLQAYATQRLFAAIYGQHNKEQYDALLTSAVWCIGEYGELLVTQDGVQEANMTIQSTASQDTNGSSRSTNENAFTSPKLYRPGAVITVLERLLRNHHSSHALRCFVVNALIKLSQRFASVPAANGGEGDGINDDTDCNTRIQHMLKAYQHSMHVELQTRVCEYERLFSSRLASVRAGIVDKMPVLDASSLTQIRRGSMASSAAGGAGAGAGDDSDFSVMRTQKNISADDDRHADSKSSSASGGSASKSSSSSNHTQSKPQTAVPDLLDLGLGDTSASSSTSAAPSSNTVDFMADIFAGVGSSNGISAAATPAAAAVAAPVASANEPMIDFFGGGAAAAPVLDGGVASNGAAAGGAELPLLTAFNQNDLIVTFRIEKDPSNPQLTTIHSVSRNSGTSPIKNFVFQAAVPKYIKLQLGSPSGTDLSANNGNSITQTIRLTNSMQGQKPILMKLRLEFDVRGEHKVESGQVNNFPPGL